jgi:hypothetical protein
LPWKRSSPPTRSDPAAGHWSTADLRVVAGRRNVVAHHSSRFYVARREKVGDRAVEEYMDRFHEQASTEGPALGRYPQMPVAAWV